MAQAPKWDAARRNARVGPQELPAEGRRGPTPKWPLEGRMRSGELRLWRELWHTPQAVMWERSGWTRVVARYCRVVCAAEATNDRTLLAEARLLENELGMTPKAMRLMLWTIVGDAVAARRRSREGKPQGGFDPRAEIRAVE